MEEASSHSEPVAEEPVAEEPVAEEPVEETATPSSSSAADDAFERNRKRKEE